MLYRLHISMKLSELIIKINIVPLFQLLNARVRYRFIQKIIDLKNALWQTKVILKNEEKMQ